MGWTRVDERAAPGGVRRVPAWRELESCTPRRADLRGNDLAGLAAATGLDGVTLSAGQLPALTRRIVHEFDITVTADR